ncbi:MAG: hypothetical protein IJW64_06580 [Clostridia bacterium]|nr:hypothetical protein [Clostridia bacterium]
MQKNNKKMQIQLPISILLLCLTIVGCGVITWFSNVDYLFWLLLIPSVFLTVQLSSLFHEFGHYSSAVKNGFEVYYFKFSIFTMDKYGRRNFRVSLFGEHLGEIRFYPKRDNDYSNALKKTLLGGIWGSVIIAVILNSVLCLSLFGVFGKVVSPYLSLIFSFSPYALYALIVNVVAWFHPENDASKITLIKKSKSQRLAIDNLYAISKRLCEGKTYAEIPKGYFLIEEGVSDDIKLPLAVYALRRAIESKDFQEIDGLVKVVESFDNLDAETRCELLYIFAVRGETDKVNEYSKVLKFDLDESEPFVLRARLALIKFNKDEQFFNALKPTALKVCNKKTFCKGDVVYNQKLIESL